MPLRTQAARWVTADPTPVMCSTRDTQPSWARSHKECLGKREQGRQKGVRRIQPVLAITNVKFKDNILFLFFFPTELMSTSSRSPLTGSNTVGKDHVTKIGCISEGSGAIDNWFLSLLKQNMLKFQELGPNDYLCDLPKQSHLHKTSRPGSPRGALSPWESVTSQLP